MLPNCFTEGLLLLTPSIPQLLTWRWCAQEAHRIALQDRDSRCTRLMQELRSLQDPQSGEGRDQEPDPAVEEPVALCVPPGSQARPCLVMPWSHVQGSPCMVVFPLENLASYIEVRWSNHRGDACRCRLGLRGAPGQARKTAAHVRHMAKNLQLCQSRRWCTHPTPCPTGCLHTLATGLAPPLPWLYRNVLCALLLLSMWDRQHHPITESGSSLPPCSVAKDRSAGRLPLTAASSRRGTLRRQPLHALWPAPPGPASLTAQKVRSTANGCELLSPQSCFSQGEPLSSSSTPESPSRLWRGVEAQTRTSDHGHSTGVMTALIKVLEL